MDEYFILNLIFVSVMTYFCYRIYNLVEKMVIQLETEVQKTHYSFKNHQPEIKMPEIKIPPPPPPIPDEWFERMEEHLTKIGDVEGEVESIKEKVVKIDKDRVKIEKLERVPSHERKFFLWNAETQEW
ncbi:MAG: hypothetical protein ACTSRU_17315, partial [Candidatus Hodarchaeales archaeon]